MASSLEQYGVEGTDRAPDEGEVTPMSQERIQNIEKSLESQQRQPERVRGSPFLTRKLLIRESCIIQDRSRPLIRNRRLTTVPAIVQVLGEETDRHGMLWIHVADSEGRSMGWINQSDVRAQEWNTRMVWRPQTNTRMYRSFEDATRSLENEGFQVIVSETLRNSNIAFPILEIRRAKNGTNYCLLGELIPPTTRGNFRIRFPVWVRMGSGRIGSLLTREEAENAAENLRYLGRRLSRLQTSEKRQNSITSIVRNGRVLELALRSGQSSSNLDRNELLAKFLKSVQPSHVGIPLDGNLFHASFSRFMQMTDEEYKIYLDGVFTTIKRLEDVQRTEQSNRIHIPGRKGNELFFIQH